jgi:hypothetical protein
MIEALRSCFDPEIPVNIYELGLIYAFLPFAPVFLSSASIKPATAKPCGPIYFRLMHDSYPSGSEVIFYAT